MGRQKARGGRAGGKGRHNVVHFKKTLDVQLQILIINKNIYPVLNSIVQREFDFLFFGKAWAGGGGGSHHSVFVFLVLVFFSGAGRVTRSTECIARVLTSCIT